MNMNVGFSAYNYAQKNSTQKNQNSAQKQQLGFGFIKTSENITKSFDPEERKALAGAIKELKKYTKNLYMYISTHIDKYGISGKVGQKYINISTQIKVPKGHLQGSSLLTTGKVEVISSRFDNKQDLVKAGKDSIADFLTQNALKTQG